ncbi:MAG: NlpC/P60 family protein [Terriglobales bacterium]
MRIKTRGALLSVLFCAAAGPFLFAQEKPASRNAAYRITNQEKDPRQKPGTPRSLNFSEGLAILGAALDSPHRGNSTSDCSHFVQAIYERAGFPYSYVSSLELYAGVDEFRRVASPQPGDLAVWRGHVGIVVNPAQRSFFSLLSSGRGVEAYDSPYWKQRGRPRFFRYVKANSADVLSGPVRGASLTPTGLGIRPRGQAVATSSPTEPPEPSNEVAPSERLLEVQPLVATIFVPVVNSGKPGRDQVSASLLKVFGDSEQALRGRDLFTLPQSLTVFDQFEVKKVHISGNQGWAEVRIHELASLSTGGGKTDKLSERQRWSLWRRDNSGWELSLPQNTVYLSQDVAVRLLAQELVSLTEGSSDSANTADQKAQLARLLDSLLKK